MVAIFSSKIVRFLWHPVVDMFLCHALPVVDRIFFRFFGMFCFVCIFFFFFLPFVNISLISLFRQYFLVYFLKLYCYFFLVLPFPFCSHILQRLSFVLSFWPVFVDFFICVSSRISHPGFDFFFVLFEEITIFSQTNFTLA